MDKETNSELFLFSLFIVPWRKLFRLDHPVDVFLARLQNLENAII
jgi:hypothetical protein